MDNRKLDAAQVRRVFGAGLFQGKSKGVELRLFYASLALRGMVEVFGSEKLKAAIGDDKCLRRGCVHRDHESDMCFWSAVAISFDLVGGSYVAFGITERDQSTFPSTRPFGYELIDGVVGTAGCASREYLAARGLQFDNCETPRHLRQVLGDDRVGQLLDLIYPQGIPDWVIKWWLQ